MREFREIDDVEDKLRISDRVTHEEAREYMKKFNKSIEESKVENDEVSKREIQEYDAIEEELGFPEMIDSSERQKYPATLDEYKVLLSRHQNIMESTTFVKDDYNARAYFKMKRILNTDEISHLSNRAQYRYLSQQFFVKAGTIKAWFMQKKIPRNISWLGRLEFRRLNPDAVTDTSQMRREYIPTSLKQYSSLLNRHPYVTDHPEFEKRDRYAKAYFEMNDIKRNGMTFTGICERFQVPDGAMMAWFYKKSVPEILQQLASNELHRIRHEQQIPSEATSHRIDSSITYEILKPYRNYEILNPSILCASILEFYDRMPENERVLFVEMMPYNRKLGPRWFLDVSNAIKENLTEIEQTLNNHIPDDVDNIRLGLVNNTLYIWKRQRNPLTYLTLLSDECFYFNPDTRKSLLEEARNHLKLDGNYLFSQLLRQITKIDDTTRASTGDVAADLRHEKEHIFGETLCFILDSVGKTLTDIAPEILAIGQQEQIENPVILENAELLDSLTRLFSITASDGHVGGRWNFLGYHEYNTDRIAIVEKLVKKFGDVTMSYIYDEGRIAGIRLPHVLGRLMIKLGIPPGDKSIQSYGLPDFILNGSPEIIRAYLEEVIPEDGSVRFYEKSKTIGISRNAVLYDIEKGEHYRFEQKLTAEHIRFIKKYGGTKKGLVEGKTLNIGKLQELSRSDATASEIFQIAYDNPVVLLNHEQKIIQRLGMTCREPKLSQIHWCKITGRVSSTWRLDICDLLSLAKWGLLAPPNDIRKRAKLIAWMKLRPDIVSKAKNELRLQQLYP